MKSDDKEKTESEVEKLKDQNALLKQKLEILKKIVDLNIMS